MEIEEPEVVQKEQEKNDPETAMKAELEIKIKQRNKLQFFSDYYQKYFPFEEIFNWISAFHEPQEMVCKEISYIVSAGEGSEEEYCIRNLGYKDVESFQTDVRLIKPLRIDIGAFFDGNIQANKNKVKDLGIQPLEREFVLDIDMTDYDSIRSCCSGKKLCSDCWNYIKAAQEVLDYILTEALGFKHILWVYSGRRGIHAWICDYEAQTMDKKLRTAVTEFLNFTISNQNSDYMIKPQLIDTSKEYYLLTKTYEILDQYKQFLFENQKILQNQYVLQKACQIANRYVEADFSQIDFKIFKNTQAIYDKLIDILQKGNIQQNQLKYYLKDQKEFTEDTYKQAKQRIIRKFNVEFLLGVLYPKLDTHVSAQVNHLLKSPFNIHHSSLNISLPIANIKEFKIDDCVSVEQLLQDMLTKVKNQKFLEALNHFWKFIQKLRDSRPYIQKIDY